MIRKDMVKPKIITLIVILLFAHLLLTKYSFAENDLTVNHWENDEHTGTRISYDIKSLKAAGKINSLEYLLNKLSAHNINRLLEVELKQDSTHEGNHPFIYEIEYINDEGMVLEIEVDALTAQVLSKEYEN
jgi:uncharacterized membrane protein YkoI